MVDKYNLPYTSFQAGDDIEPTQFNSDFVYVEDALNELDVDVLTKATVSSSTSTPSTTPSRVGLIHVETDTGFIFMSKGTSSVADWVKIYPQ